LTHPSITVWRAASERVRSGRLRWAKRCLWLTLFLPFAYLVKRSSQEIEQGFGVYDVIRGGGALVLVVLAVMLAPCRRRGMGLVELAAFLYCAVALISTLWSINPPATASKAVLLSAAYFAVFRLVRLYENAADALSALAVVVHTLLVWCIAQAILFPDLAIVRGSVDTTPRLVSVVPSIGANPLGFLALAGIVALVLNIGPRLVRNIPARVVLGCLYLTELFMTRTRTALLIGILVLLLTVVVNMKLRPVLATYVVLLAAGGALLAFTTYPAQVASYFRRGQSSAAFQTLTGRTDVWNVAWTVVEEHPITGLGFYAGHRLGMPILNAYQERSNLDNTWIEALVDVGVLGTIPLAVMLLAGWFRAMEARHEPAQFRLWALALLSYAVLISFVSPTVQSGLGMNWVLTLFAAAAFIRQSPESGVPMIRASAPAGLTARERFSTQRCDRAGRYLIDPLALL
jgi:O-antigen ligase